MYTGKELFEMWQSSGLSQRQLAKKLGMNFNKLHGLIFRAQKSESTLLKTDNSVDMTQFGNERQYTSKGSRIKTLEQLIEECEIDLDKWIIERHVVNKWEVGAKLETGGIVVEPLFQVKAWLINRKPEAIEPVISAVELKIKPYKLHKPKAVAYGRLLVLADMHFGFLKNVHDGTLTPFHDRDALAAVLSLIKYVNPDIIIIVGDILDLAEWSDKFIRSPDMYNTTQPALTEAAWYLAQIRELAPEIPIYLLEGNHEERITRAINKQIPYAYGITQPHSGLPILSVPNMLSLDKLGITYVGQYPDGEIWLANNLRAIHGEKVRAKSGATATATLDDAQATTIYGHIHRLELASKTLFDSRGARTISAFSPGCLCRIDGIVPATKSKNNWQQGVGVVDFNERFVAITPVPIEQGAAMYGGKEHTGQDYLEQLKADTSYAF